MNGISATKAIPSAMVIQVAPIMMITRPAAAKGVRPVLIFKSPGRTMASPPRTSHVPMNRRNRPGN